MRNQNFSKYFFYFLITVTFFFSVSQSVSADDIVPTPGIIPEPEIILPTIKVHLQLETFNQTLYDDDFVVEACLSTASSTEATLNAWCAVEQLAETKGWTINYSTSGDAKFLSAVNDYNGADYNWWAFFHNLDFAGEALNQYILSADDHILLTYGVFPLKVESIDNPLINTSTTIKAYAFGFDPTSWAPVWSLSPNTIISINGQEDQSLDGTYEFFSTSTTPYSILAKKDGFINSESIVITPRLPVMTVNLQIQISSGVLYNGPLTVSACEKLPGSGIYTLNGYCAVEQAGTVNNWTWSGDLAFLNSVNQVANDFTNGVYWGWFGNLEYGQVALNQHLLQENETLLLVYGTNPLKVVLASSTPSLNTTTTISVQEFGLDVSWNPVWLPSVSSTVVINNQEYSTIDSESQLFISTTTPYSIYGKKDGYISSAVVEITGQVLPTAELIDDPVVPPGDPPPSGGGGGGGGGYSITHNKIDVSKAVNFLSSQQNSDGSFGSVLYTDWAAVAFSSLSGESEAKSKLKNYLLTDPSAIGGLNPIADYARRAMALMVLNIDPYSGTATDYIKKITDAFDGQQIGDPTLVNDDIFALFPLLKSCYTTNDSIVTGTVKFILSQQNQNGSWGSVDLTAAAVQALSLTSSIEGVNTAINNAKMYLHGAQSDDGGFGNSFSTSWVLPAIASLSEAEENWMKNNKTPNDYLYSQQQVDGGVENVSMPTSTRIWATAYAIPATVGKSWNQLLNSFSKPVVGGVTDGVGGYPVDVVTSSLGVVTSTSTIATTTLEIIEAKPLVMENLPVNLVEDTPVVAGNVGENRMVQEKKEVNVAAVANTDETAVIKSASNDLVKKEQNEKIINELPLNASTRRTAKKIMVISGGSALAVGVYLGLKFFKNLV